MRATVESCTNSNYGARLIKRFIKDNFINAITKIILAKTSKEPQEITCFLNEEGVEGQVFGNYTYLIS